VGGWVSQFLTIKCLKIPGVIPQAYSPLNHGQLGSGRNTHLEPLRPNYPGKTGAQIAYKWVAQHGVGVCMSADDSDHRVTEEFTEDMGLFDFTLTDDDMTSLDHVGGSDNPASCYRNAGHGGASSSLRGNEPDPAGR
jgi:diketogulonate reductase-like aldo/keto reductase